MNRVLLISAILTLAAPFPALAQGSAGDNPQVMNMGGASSGVGEVDLGPFGTTERAPPTISKIEFTVIPPAATLQERIDRLLHGLRTPVAHEHDHYGYEIRRYMARIGDQEIFQDTERLQEELKNVGRAKIIIRHWRAALRAQMDEIEAAIEASPDPTLKSKYDYASGTASATLAEIENWIVNNERMLEFLTQTQGTYEVNYPNLTFTDAKDSRQFLEYYKAAGRSLANIHDYTPWSGMVY